MNYAESSNLAMHLRCIIRNCELRFTRIYNVSEWVYLGLYMFFRGLFVPVMVYNSWASQGVPLFVRLSATLLYAQSAYYIFE